MNPATLLTASCIAPVRVSSALPGLHLERVVIRPAPIWLTRLWGRSVSAMTLRTSIYIRADRLNADPADLGRLILHELVHVHQWSRLGFVRFLWRYLAGYCGGRLTGLSHQDAYRAIPLEVEARQTANQLQRPAGPV